MLLNFHPKVLRGVDKSIWQFGQSVFGTESRYSLPMKHELSVFVWTEALGCGEILDPMIRSYLAHHSFPIHVIGYREDFQNLPLDPRVIPMVIDEAGTNLGLRKEEVVDAYNFGHKGTALLWARIIKDRSEDLLIHFDADNIFVGEVLSLVLTPLQNGYSISGTRRPYRHRLSGSTILDSLRNHFRRDCVNTHSFGFNRSLINLSEDVAMSFIEGRGRFKFSSYILPVIDFFDNLTFYLARRGRGVFYLDSEFQLRHGHHSRYGVMESRLISFAAVGSGSAFYKNPQAQTSESYKDFAISSYSLFSKYLLGQDVDYPVMESSYLLGLLARLDKETWTLRKAAGE